MAAFVSVLQQTTSLLTSEPYVALISLDFTKAFDTTRHSALARKLAILDILDETYNLIISFLEDCLHVTRFYGRLSAIAISTLAWCRAPGLNHLPLTTSHLTAILSTNATPLPSTCTPIIRICLLQLQLGHLCVWS